MDQTGMERAAMAPPDVANRIGRLRALLDRARPDGGPVDGLVVTASANIRWLSGFSGSAGSLLVTGERALLVTDGRYRTQAAEQLGAGGVATEIDVSIGGVEAQHRELAAAAGAAGLRTVGLEADQVSWSAKRSFEELFAPAALSPTRGVVEQLRMVKDAGEVARMERA
ncbi:MAG: aminopeptidase P family N-terminal domain-containing protein, partial [Acidimicrobiales bacterium]